MVLWHVIAHVRDLCDGTDQVFMLICILLDALWRMLGLVASCLCKHCDTCLLAIDCAHVYWC